ncbi:mucin-17 [Filimonas sp.]|nr:mucin-17 [Filimonas sp.]
MNCYCIPSGPSSFNQLYQRLWLLRGLLSISNNTNTTYSTVPSLGYADYTTMAVSANPSGTVNITVTYLTGSHRVGVWADWNKDGDFNDANENPILSTSAAASPFIGSFTVPASALVGNTRLRVRITNVGAPAACGFDANGETEDYSINVLGPCSSAAVANIATTTYTICPSATQVLTATVPLFQLGTTFQWKQSTTPGGPYTNVVGGSGATTLSYTTAPLATGNYYYILEATCANCGPCSATSNEAYVFVQSLPAPIATNSAQCAPGVPTAFVTSAAGAGGTGNFNWYNAPTAGTLLQSQPYGPVVPYYFNNFSSISLVNSSIAGNASILGGVLQVHPNSAAQYGALMVNASGFNSDKYTVDFDYANTGTLSTMGEGYSYSFSDDGVITAEASMNAENGTGSRLKLCFVALTNGAAVQGIYLIYGNSTTNEPTPSSPGVYGYSGNVAWKASNGHVKLMLDSLGRATVILNGTTIFNNIQLPAAYLSANKSAWKHIWKGRTTTSTMLTSFDNVDIQQSTLVTGTPTYLSSVVATTTFYVDEKGTNGCFSSRTPVTVTVNTPPTLSINPIPNDSVCTGAPLTLSGSGAVSYIWNGNPTTVNGDTTFSSAVAGTFTVTGTDANSCTNTKTITIYLHPVLSGTATATPNAFCLGGNTALTATATPICTGLSNSGFSNYYTPAFWTFDNVSANGTLITTGSPANVKLTTGTDGSFNFGTTTLSRKVTCSGTITCNWSFIHLIDAYADYPQYSINGGTPVDFPGYNTSLYNATQTGTLSIPVVDGDSISFHVVTIDNDNFTGTLTLSNFVAPSPKITGSISYWNAPTGGTNLGTPPLNVTPSAAGTVTYYAAYTSNTTGCVNMVRQPVSVTVRPLATATLSGGGTVCTGSTLPDVQIALTGTAPWNLTYTFNGTPVTVTGVMNSPYVIANAAVGTYIATNASDAYCSGSGSGTATVALYTLPTATVSGGGTICAGNTLPDVSIALTGTAPWSVTYTDGTTPMTVTGIAASPYIITAASAGNYSVTNVSDLNCTGTSGGSANVMVNTLPNVTATMTPPIICYANSAVATGGGAVSYAWDNGITDNTPFIGYTTTTYIVTGTDANNCSATSSVTLTVSTVGSNLSQATSGNASSVTGAESDMNTQPDGTNVVYSDASCNLIATIQDLLGGNALGSTTTTVTVDPTVLTYPAVNGQPYSRRWYVIQPTNNVGVNATVTLYQAQDDSMIIMWPMVLILICQPTRPMWQGLPISVSPK